MISDESHCNYKKLGDHYMGVCLLATRYKEKKLKVLMPPASMQDYAAGPIFQVNAGATITWNIGNVYKKAIVVYSLWMFTDGTNSISYSADNSNYTLIAQSGTSMVSGNKLVSDIGYIRYYNSGSYAERNVAVLVEE